MRHVYECKIDNKLRLKQVRNLEELIKFRIKTVGDNMAEEGTLVNPQSQQRGLYDLRKVVDPLLTGAGIPAIRSSTKESAMQQPSPDQIRKKLEQLEGYSLEAMKSDELIASEARLE